MRGGAVAAGAIALAALGGGCGGTGRAREVAVPDLVGRDGANAQRLLVGLGLRWRWDDRSTRGAGNAFRPASVILAQTPGVGRLVSRGTVVVLVPGSARVATFARRPG